MMERIAYRVHVARVRFWLLVMVFFVSSLSLFLLRDRNKTTDATG